MKRIVGVLLILIVLFAVILFAIPTFFKKNLLEVSKNTLNKQLNAKVEFADLKLSLFKNFPKATIQLNNFIIKGTGDFEKDTLLNAPSVRTTMNLSSLFSKSDMRIEEIIVHDAKLNLLVSEQGKENWELANSKKETKSTDKKEKTSDTDVFQLQLEKIELNNTSVSYNDKLAKLQLQLADINLDISGEMYGSTTQLQSSGEVSNVLFLYNDVAYVSNTSLDIKTLLDADFEAMKFTIAENQFKVNRLPLELSGSLEIPKDTVFIDFKLQTKESDFENFLALIPPTYEKYLEGIKTQGNATISGKINGFYAGESYPAFDLGLNISNGQVQYADMPEKIEDIKAIALLKKPQGDFDLMQVIAKEAHAAINNNPLDLTMKVTSPVSNPYFDGTLVGKIDLGELKEALPIDSFVNISGIIDANILIKGKYSDIETGNYENINSDGKIDLKNLIYASEKLTRDVVVPSGRMVLSPQYINLQGFGMKVGSSDFSLSGKITNYLNYLLKNGTLKGNLQLKSQKVNINELLRLQKKEVKDKQQAETINKGKNPKATEETLAFDVPERIDILFHSDIENAIYNRLPISNIVGLIQAINQKVILKNLSMNMFDGQVKINGSYKNTPQNQPLFDFGFDVLNFDIPLASSMLLGVKDAASAVLNSSGRLSSSLSMKGRLNEQMKLISATTNGKGSLNTKNLEINNSPIFNQLGGMLKKEKLKRVNVDDFKANFTLENGNLLLKPFKTKVIGQETNVKGSLNTDNLLNMRLDFNVQRELFGPDIEKLLGFIPGNEKIKTLPAGVIIKGPIGEPKVNMDLSATQKAVTDATKNDIKNTLKGLQNIFR